MFRGGGDDDCERVRKIDNVVCVGTGLFIAFKDKLYLATGKLDLI